MTRGIRAARGKLAGIDGLVGAVVVDLDRGAIESSAGRGKLEDLELSALQDGIALERVRDVVEKLDGDEVLLSVIFTTARHHVVMLPSRHLAKRFLYLVVERSDSALGLLLHRLEEAGVT